MRIKLRVAEDMGTSPYVESAAREPRATEQGLAAWLLQTFRQRRGRSSERRMEVLETLVLGPKRHLTLVECDGRTFLVGGGSESVAAILQIEQTPVATDLAQPVAGADLALDVRRPGRRANDAAERDRAEAGAVIAARDLDHRTDAALDSGCGPDARARAGTATASSGASSPALVAEEILQALREMQSGQEESRSTSSDLTRNGASTQRQRPVPLPMSVAAPEDYDAPAASDVPSPSSSAPAEFSPSTFASPASSAAPASVARPEYAAPVAPPAVEPVLWAAGGRGRTKQGASAGPHSVPFVRAGAPGHQEVLHSGPGEVRRGDGADRMRAAVREAVARMGEDAAAAPSRDRPLSSFSRHPLPPSGEDAAREYQERKRPQSGVGGWA